jgi:hypothetical protein
MPDTFFSLIIFVICLGPGFAYSATRNLILPERTSSSFRETTRVVLASLVFDGAVLAVFALIRITAPGATPDIGRLVRQGSGYVRSDYSLLFLWFCILIVAAAGAAAIAARLLPRGPGPVSVESSWWLLFRRYPRQIGAKSIHVGCELVDGSYLSGTLKHFAHQDEESGDREFALGAPLRYRTKEMAVVQPLLGHQFVSVSARQIKFLTVTYLDHIPTMSQSAASHGTDSLA